MTYYTQYCDQCYFTVYPNEGKFNKAGKAVHIDCKEAQYEPVRRSLNPRIEQMLGTISRKKLKRMWEEYDKAID